MRKRTVAYFSAVSALFIITWSCAKVSSPVGGIRDRIPPVVLATVPEYQAKNFKGEKVAITFDEYVTLNSINEKFMVSPPMKKKPRVFMRGKNVIVEFAEKLRDSTTYTLYFQDAIRDLNEGNILGNYQFVFSTGPVVDSLSVTGNVYNAGNLEVPEKTMVLLYRELADSFVVKHIPDYISRVDLKGYFRISNVREGLYRLYALKDNDNSKNYNFPEEEFAFMNSFIAITNDKNYIPPVKDTMPVIKKKAPLKLREEQPKKVINPQDTIVPKGEYSLMLFTAPKKNHYLSSSSRPMKYQMVYTLSLPPDSLPFVFTIPEVGPGSYFIENSRNNDTIRVWLTDSTLYKQSQIPTIVRYPFTDTLGITSYKQDTIDMRFLTPKPTRGTKIRKTAFAATSNIKSNSLKPGQEIIWTSVTPFRQPDTSLIRLYIVTDSGRMETDYRFIRDSTNACRYFFKADIKEDTKYLLIADRGSFGNIFNENSDSTGIGFSVKDPESYSKITLNIRNCTTASIIQLMNKTEQVVSESIIKTDGKIVFPLLESGTYRVKVIYDLDGNGKWTTGDFNTGRQPEPVSYYPQEIDLKTGWEIEQDWDISKQDFKAEKLREKKTEKK